MKRVYLDGRRKKSKKYDQNMQGFIALRKLNPHKIEVGIGDATTVKNTKQKKTSGLFDNYEHTHTDTMRNKLKLIN